MRRAFFAPLALLALACSGAEDATAVTSDAGDAAPTQDAAIALDAAGDAPASDAAPGDAAVPKPKPAYYVAGGKLYDPCGVEVVLRGVNKMAVFLDRKGDSFPEIAKSGANAVRFMWLTSVPASEAVQTLQRAVDSGLIPIWEMHDATGDFSKMPAIEAFWTDPATVKVLAQFESHMILNIANEAGQTVSDNTLTTTYGGIVTKLRNAGLRMPLMIDAAGYGRNVEQLLSVAPTILAADPLKNVLFSWHEYDSGNGEAARIDAAFTKATTQGIPFLVGEFGSVSPGACQLAVPYQHLITAAQAKGIGYLPWSWDNQNGDCKQNGSSQFDMVGDGLHFSTLKAGWATEVVTTDPASIQKTAKKTPWQTSKSGSCGS